MVINLYWPVFLSFFILFQYLNIIIIYIINESLAPRLVYTHANRCEINGSKERWIWMCENQAHNEW
jgi:hypothetical protein